MAHFLTASTAGYLPNVLALHRSLTRSCPSFTLRVVAMDGVTDRLLGRLALPGLTIYPVGHVEELDPALGEVKPGRSAAEYAWTLKASSLLFAFAREPDLPILTWLGSDILFFSDPEPMFTELGDASIGLVPHNFHPRWEKKLDRVGPYNADTVTFRRSAVGMAALRHWRERCIEWCYAVPKDGLFGDQRYLDDWPERFEGVHVARHPGVGLTKSNARRFTLERQPDGGMLVDGRPLVFYHYTSHRVYGGIANVRRLGLLRRDLQLTRAPVPLVWGTPARIELPEEWYLWRLYMRRLSEETARLRDLEPGYAGPFRDGRAAVRGSLARSVTQLGKRARRRRRNTLARIRRARRRTWRAARRGARRGGRLLSHLRRASK